MDTRHLSEKEKAELHRLAAAQDWDAYFAFCKLHEDTAKNRLKKTLLVVEATSFEQHFLWLAHAKHNSPRPYPRNPVYTWEQLAGWLVTVGKVGKRPVCISTQWVKIDGHLVLFWEATSQVVDHKLIDKWFKENYTGTYDKGTRPAMTDANNFHNMTHLIEEAKFWM